MIFALGVLLLVGFASAAIPEDCDDNMVAYWQMEGNILDSFGSHDGVASSFPSTSIGFVVGNAADFNGNQMISISDTGQVLDLHEGAFAIEFWVQKNEFADPVDAFLLNKGNYNIQWTSANTIEATVIDNSDNSVTVTSDPLTPGTNYHVVLTWLGAGGVLNLYVNNAVHDSSTVDNPGASSDALEIGENFVGLIDEVALYDRSFDADDIKIHYTTSLGGFDYCYPAGAGDVSSTKVEFVLAGCVLSDGSSISAGSCSRNGMYYCSNETLILYETFYDGGGCIMEDLNYKPKEGMERCCPGGYVCNDDPDDELGEELGLNAYVCNLNPQDCVDIIEQGECDLADCFWLSEGADDGTGICVSNPSDYSCSIYKSNISCSVDVWNVGSAGMGTEVCGTYFVVNLQGYVIPQDSCKCDWTSVTETIGNYCKLGYDVVPDIYGDIANTFRCQKDFDVTDCIEGLQMVTWEAGPTNPQGAWENIFDIPPAVLEAAGCVTDNTGIERSCGEPIVKLPGFSLFALMSSLGIIGLIYFWKRE